MTNTKKTRQQHIYDELIEEIIDGEKASNRLAPVKALTERFGVSRFTIQNVMARLEEEGYIERIHGRGTFIHERISPLSMDEVVSICLIFHQHLYGDLCTALIDRLQKRNKAVTLIDPSNRELLKKLSFTPSKYFFIDGNNFFDYTVFNMRSFQNKIVIGLLQWPTSSDSYHRVLCDWTESVSLRIEHLRELGHKRIIYMVSGGQKNHLQTSSFTEQHIDTGACRDFLFLRRWQELGNEYTLIETSEKRDPYLAVDEQELVAEYKRLKPTAIVGSRDIDVVTAYNTLLPVFPEIENKICMLGFFDTPWAQAVPGGMTTVSLNLEQIAENAVNIIDLIEKNNALSTIVMKVKPTLVVRNTSLHA